MDKNYLKELILKRYNTAIIKGALVTNTRSLESQAEDWREDQYILVLAAELLAEWLKRRKFKLQNKDKLRVDLRYRAYFILLQIAYIDNQYRIYKRLKEQNNSQLLRIE